MGYKTVQLSAVGPIPAEKLRELCDKHGLKIVLTHWNPDRILNDTEAVIKEHDIMGCDYIGPGHDAQEVRHPRVAAPTSQRTLRSPPKRSPPRASS